MREENMPGVGRSLVRAWMRAALVVTFTLVLTSSLTSISWAKPRYKTLHTFTKKLAHFPVAGLVADPLGNLYGTTLSGGSNGAGTVFELAPNDHGGWTETVLHSFNYADGANPRSSLVFDSAGNLYGTTADGGASGAGTVFKLVLDSHGAWNETILHSFTFNGVDGFYPYAGLISDSAGNLFGTTQSGGASGDGTVFELAPDGHGGWAEKVLHRFKNRPGALPSGNLVFGLLGHLYGTTSGDGQVTWGSVFEVAP